MAIPFLFAPHAEEFLQKWSFNLQSSSEVPFSPGRLYWSNPERVYHFLLTYISGILAEGNAP